MAQTDGKIYPALGLKESILSKWLYYQGNLQIQCNPNQITNGTFLKTVTKIEETQKTSNSQRKSLEKRTELEKSGSLGSDYITKLW